MLQWLGEAHGQMQTPERAQRIVKCWESSGLLRAWQEGYQREAIQRECELFGNVARERRGLDDEPDGEAEMEVGEEDGFLDDDVDEDGPDVWETFDADVGTGSQGASE